MIDTIPDRYPSTGAGWERWLFDGARMALRRYHPDIPKDMPLPEYISGLKARIAELEARLADTGPS